MKVILLTKVAGLGKVGDIKNVSDGYAKNYLLPKKLADMARPGIVAQIEKKIARQKELIELAEAEAKKIAAEIEGLEIDIFAKAGKADKLFGSVTAEMIAKILSKKINRPIHQEMIEIPNTIKQLGSAEVIVKLRPTIEAKIKINVKKEEK